MHVAYHAYSMKGKDMPQVAARISDNQERWLKDYFRTKSAGAEFILPWAVDTFFELSVEYVRFYGRRIKNHCRSA